MKAVLIATLAVAVATVSAAEAKPRKHHRAHHRHHHSAAVKQVKPNPFVFSFAAFVNPTAAAAQSKRSSASRRSSPADYRHGASFAGFGGGSSLIATARSYAGTNPTRRSRQWCGEFMGLVVRKTGGRIPEGYAKASSWAKLPRTTMHPGAVAVMPHHVGIVTGECEGGGVRIVSGNHGRRVGEGCYPRRRIIAFVAP